MAREILSALDTKVLNSDIFFQSMHRLMGASIGVIAVRTREFARAKELLHQWASLVDLKYQVWTIHTGFQVFNKLPVTDESGDNKQIDVAEDMSSYLIPVERLGSTLPIDGAFQFFVDREGKEQTDGVCGVFIGFSEDDFKNQGIQQYVRDHTQRAHQSNDRIIFLLEPGAVIPDAIKTDVEVIDLLPPSFAELMEVLSEYSGEIVKELGLKLTAKDKQYIIQNAIGMTNQEFEDALALAMVDAGDAKKRDEDFKASPDTFVNVIKDRKLTVLKNTEILELMSDAVIEDVGGQDLLKAFLLKRSKTFSPEAKKFGIRPPKGVMLVGPPGTAKSLIGRATGSVLGIPCIKLAFDRVYAGIVGSSEKRLRSAFAMLESMAPAVVFMDELDKMFSNDGGNDSGVSKRILGMTLTWMQEKHDRQIPLFIVASANDVSNFPPELIRKGRFDEIFAVTLPSPVERAAIFKIHVDKRGHTLTEEEYIALARATESYVGSELEAAVEEALVDDFDAGHKKLLVSSIKTSIERMVPQSKAHATRIKRMKEWAENFARPASTQGSFGPEPSANLSKPSGPRPVPRPKRLLRTGD